MQCRKETFKVCHVKAIDGSKSYGFFLFSDINWHSYSRHERAPAAFLVNRLIRYANSLLLDDSRNVVYYDFQDNNLTAGCGEKWMIYWHSFKKMNPFFVKRQAILLGLIL